ncbi:unnamed protein product [Leptosia nina]|uniref:Inositol polyphosphate-related phosphatase domain-containing protein n=1 Tax=Leptosia nina TaxID=320188 RepID=A0AAV1JT98_9NEOP
MDTSSSIVEQFGKYQILQIILTCLPGVFNSMSNVNFVFVAGDINYRCRVPECEADDVFSPPWWPNSSEDRCLSPLYNKSLNGICTNTSFHGWDHCTSWIYESNDTVIAELDLACQRVKSNMIGTVHNVAMAISMFSAGWVADW